MNQDTVDNAVLRPAQHRAWQIARVAWVALIALCVLWEWQLAPIRPGGSWLVLKAVPLLLPLAGVWQGRTQAMQWAVMLVLLYLCEGVVRLFDATPRLALPLTEMALAVIFYICAIVYLRPFKKAARARASSEKS